MGAAATNRAIAHSASARGWGKSEIHQTQDPGKPSEPGGQFPQGERASSIKRDSTLTGLQVMLDGF